MGWAVLKLTDGTKAGTIDLLNTSFGYLLDDWRPAIQIPKSGGIWNGSPLTDGRRLAMRNYDNAIEVFNLKASKGGQDELIREIQNLFRLMDKAVNYWIADWQTEPVWIEAKATNETNSRYAIIVDYRVAGLNNPYSQPFFACPSIEDELALTIERDYWTENEPGTATGIEISAQQTYNGITYGREATTEDEVFIANKHVMANITHAYHWDSAGAGTFSGNLIGAGKPFAFLPSAANLSTGDRIYFGCDTSLLNSGPFTGVMFDVVVSSTNITSIDWYFWDGAWTAFNPLLITDTTNKFATLGTTYINFDTGPSWIENDPGVGVTGFWIYGEVTCGANPTPPQQGNRDFYAPVVPFVDIDEAQVPGDVPALMKSVVANCFYTNYANELNIVAGIRSRSRGTIFTPYINLSDTQNISGIALTAGTDVAAVDRTNSPTGRSYQWTATTDADAPRLTVSFTYNLLQQYTGRYAVYLRFSVGTDGNSNVYLKTKLWLSANEYYDLYESKSQAITANGLYAFDMGIITIPQTIYSKSTLISSTTPIFMVDICGNSDDGANSIYFYDIVFMPVDEWSSKYYASWNGVAPFYDTEDYTAIDSISSPSSYHYAELYDSTDIIKAPLSVNSAGQSVLQPNTDQRLWFFIEGGNNAYTSSYIGNPNASRVRLWRNARYMAMRGNR